MEAFWSKRCGRYMFAWECDAVWKTSVFPASRETVFRKFQRLDIQYIARPCDILSQWEMLHMGSGYPALLTVFGCLAHSV